MRNSIAAIKICVGILGLVACYFTYQSYGPQVKEAFVQMDQLAGEAQVQAKVTDEVLGEWTDLLVNVDTTLGTHQRTLDAMQGSGKQISSSLSRWRSSMRGFAQTSDEASQVFAKFATHLPLRIPNVEMETREVAFEIPDIKLKNQIVKLPYPTANVGTRKVEIDVGLTDLKFDVPTLNVGTRNRTLTVPISPEVTKRTEKITVPSDVNLNYREILSDEKEVLNSTSGRLKEAARNTRDSITAIESVERLMREDLTDSISQSKRNLEQSRESLQRSYNVELPALKERLKRGSEALANTQSNFRDLQGIVPILFAFVAMIPLGLVLSGVQSFAWRSYDSKH